MKALIDRSFKSKISGKRLVVCEGEKLRDVNSCDARFLIDPIIRIGEPGPHQSAGGPTRRQVFVIHLKGKTPTLG